ncbi:hypothetical protein [Pedobacter sp. NJ-S-72]
MQYILGIDIGTGSTKAVAVGTDHKAFDSSQYFYPKNAMQISLVIANKILN